MTLLLIMHISIAVLLIALVFMQYGRSGDMGAGMGGGGSANSVFGASGSADFISKVTGVVGVLFFMSSLGVGAMYKRGLVHSDQPGNSLMQDYVPKLPSPGVVPSSDSSSVPQGVNASVPVAISPVQSADQKVEKNGVKQADKAVSRKENAKQPPDLPHFPSVGGK